MTKSNYLQTTAQGAWEPETLRRQRARAATVPRPQPVAVDNSYNAFLQESTLDEIAFMGGADPIDLRRKLMSAHPMALSLIDKVAGMSGWRTPLPGNRARGFAFTLAFGTWVAQVVQVVEREDGIGIERVFCAADPGIVFDRSNFSERMRAGIIQSLSVAMGGAARFADATVATRVDPDEEEVRLCRLPEIEIEILANAGHMSGAGEPGAPSVLPALANAVFALTGKRVRLLPLGDEVTFV